MLHINHARSIFEQGSNTAEHVVRQPYHGKDSSATRPYQRCWLVSFQHESRLQARSKESTAKRHVRLHIPTSRGIILMFNELPTREMYSAHISSTDSGRIMFSYIVDVEHSRPVQYILRILQCSYVPNLESHTSTNRTKVSWSGTVSADLCLG